MKIAPNRQGHPKTHRPRLVQPQQVLDMKTDPNPVVFTYECKISIGGPPPHKTREANEALNRAWGFADGNCNIIDAQGTIVGKPEADDPAFIEANYAMNRYTQLTIEVSLHKNGEKSYRLKSQ